MAPDFLNSTAQAQRGNCGSCRGRVAHPVPQAGKLRLRVANAEAGMHAACVTLEMVSAFHSLCFSCLLQQQREKSEYKTARTAALSLPWGWLSPEVTRKPLAAEG